MVFLLASCATGGQQSAAPTTVTIATSSIPTILDANSPVPAGGNATSASTLINYTAGLMKLKPIASDSKTLGKMTDVVPELATSYTVAPEGVTFELRQAKAPSGNVLTPDDVVYSYKRAVALSALAKFLLNLANINTADPISVLGPHTVRLNGNPTLAPTWPIETWFYAYSILDSKTVKLHATETDPWATNWLQTNYPEFGPYQIKSFVPNERLTLSTNPNYWGPKPAFSTVQFTGFGGQSAFALLSANAIGVVEQVPLVDFSKITKTSKFHALAAPTVSQESVRLDQLFKPFQDSKVRQAMSLAIDRSLIVQGPYYGVASAARSVVSTAILDASPQLTGLSGQYFKTDLSQAKQLMAQSGYPNGFDFTLQVNQASFVSGVDGQAVAVNIQSMLKGLNINVTIGVEPNPAVFRANLIKHAYAAFYWTESPLPPDAAYAMNNWHVKGGSANYTGESDNVINVAIPQAMKTTVGPERDSLARKGIEAFNANMHDLPLVDIKAPFASQASICGLAPSQSLVVVAAALKPC